MGELYLIPSIQRKHNTSPSQTTAQKKKKIEEETLPNSFFEATITVTPKQKILPKKKIRGQYL